MSIDEFTPVMGPSAVRTNLNAMRTAVNTLEAATAPTYARKLTLWPEYPGMAWYSTDLAYGYGYQIEGNMPNIHHDDAGGRNWYEWSSVTGAAETVRASLRWTLPEQWNGWSTSAITLALWASAVDDTATVALKVYRNTTLVHSHSAAHPTVASTWENTVFTDDDILHGSWVAGDILTVEFIFSAESTATIRLGETVLAYTELG